MGLGLSSGKFPQFHFGSVPKGWMPEVLYLYVLNLYVLAASYETINVMLFSLSRVQYERQEASFLLLVHFESESQ